MGSVGRYVSGLCVAILGLCAAGWLALAPMAFGYRGKSQHKAVLTDRATGAGLALVSLVTVACWVIAWRRKLRADGIVSGASRRQARPGARARATARGADRPRLARLRGPHRARESEILDGARRPARGPRGARRRARGRRARPARGRARAHLLGGDEAAALARALRPRAPPRPPPRRAVRRARSAREKVARGASRGVQGPRRRHGHGHAQLRPRTCRRRPNRHSVRRRDRAGHPARVPRAGRDRAALPVAHGGGLVIFARRAWSVVWKDLLVERRSKETLNALAFFSLLLLFVFQFALGPDRERLAAALPGLLWLGFVLAGLLGLGRTFVLERENDCWEGLILAPGDKSAIYVGKLAANVTLMLVVEGLILLLFAVFFNVDLG